MTQKARSVFDKLKEFTDSMITVQRRLVPDYGQKIKTAEPLTAEERMYGCRREIERICEKRTVYFLGLRVFSDYSDIYPG